MILFGSMKKAAFPDLKKLNESELLDHLNYVRLKKAYSLFFGRTWEKAENATVAEFFFRLKDLRRKNEALIGAEEKRLEPKIVDFHVNAGGAEVTMKVAKEVMTHIASSLTVMLDQAENYVEVDMFDKAVGQHYTMIIQRRAKKTPHELRREAEEEVKTLKGQIENLKDHFGFRDGGKFWMTCDSDCTCRCGVSGLAPCTHCEHHTIIK